MITPQRWNAYSYALNNLLAYVDPDGRDAIAIGFTKYRIGTSESVGSSPGVPFIGHSGIVLIGKDGSTAYLDYGRYPGPADGPPGVVREFELPNVEFGSNGLPTRQSLSKVLAAVSAGPGKGGSVEGAYFKTSGAEDQAMRAYVYRRFYSNWNSTRPSYQTGINDCQQFCNFTLVAGRQLTPLQALGVPARPISAIGYLQALGDITIRYEKAKQRERVETKCHGIEGCEEPE